MGGGGRRGRRKGVAGGRRPRRGEERNEGMGRTGIQEMNHGADLCFASLVCCTRVVILKCINALL